MFAFAVKKPRPPWLNYITLTGKKIIFYQVKDLKSPFRRLKTRENRVLRVLCGDITEKAKTEPGSAAQPRQLHTTCNKPP